MVQTKNFHILTSIKYFNFTVTIKQSIIDKLNFVFLKTNQQCLLNYVE